MKKFVNLKNFLNSANTTKYFIFLIVFLSFVNGCHRAENSESQASNNELRETGKTTDRGEQIVAEYLKADAAAFRQSRLRFTIIDETDPPVIYEIDMWRKQSENETLTLTHIIKPIEDSELSSLADEVKDKETVLTTYVTSRDQFRETGSNKSLFGGIPAQELLGEWSKYNFHYIGDKDLNSVKVFEVEGKLKAAKNSQAAQITADFRQDNNMPAELHLFDSTGKEIRIFRIRNYQTIAGRTYVSKMEIENKIYKTRVMVDVLSMNFPDRIEDSFFTREQLKKNAGK